MSKKEKILIVNNDILLTSMIDNLLNEKYTIDVAFSGQDAIAILRKQHHLVILLDTNLQDMSGLDLLKKIKQLRIPSEVIILADNQNSETVINTKAIGTFDYIYKPLTFKNLDSSITKALVSYHVKMRAPTRQRIIDTLKQHEGNQAEAADALNIDTNLLYQRIIDYQISPKEIT